MKQNVVMENSKNRTFKAVLYLGMVIVSFLVTFWINSNNLNDKAINYLLLWEPEIASEIITKKTFSLLNKIEKQVKELGLVVKKKSVFSTIEVQASGYCFRNSLLDLKFQSITTARLEICQNPVEVLKQSLYSPLFIALLFLIIIPMEFYRNLSLRQAAMALTKFLDFLESSKDVGAVSPKNSIEQRLFNNYFQSLRLKQEGLLTQAKNRNLEEMARESRQVAHDLRSPLSALTVLVDSADELPTEKMDLLRAGVDRVKQIADDLMGRARESLKESKQVSADVVAVLEMAIVEKGIEHKDFAAKLHGDEEKIMVPFSISDLARMGSILLQNAYEARQMNVPFQLEINLKKQNEVCEILFTDNGMGIPAEVLPQLFQEGATFNKAGGTGLGLYWVKKQLEKVKGNIQIESEQKIGTKVKLTIPRV